MTASTPSAGAASSSSSSGTSPQLFGSAPPTLGGPSITKPTYKDPSGANTLISQAARIPMGAAQPTPKTPSNPFLSMFPGSGSNRNLNGVGPTSGGLPSPSSRLPNGAATGSKRHGSMGGGGQPKVDCSMIMPMIMSKVMATGEGMTSPEAMEAIGEMRKQYLPYTCQELTVTYTGMPFRLCCPGKGQWKCVPVSVPTLRFLSFRQ